jgi:hypothetical protein
MKYRLIAFELDTTDGTRSVRDILEVDDNTRGCSTPSRAVAKLLRFAEKQGIDLAEPFEIQAF